MNPKNKYIDAETLMQTALPILGGLLASGHYTEINPDEDNEPTFKQYDTHETPHRFRCHAVSDALQLAEDLLREIEEMCEP